MKEEKINKKLDSSFPEELMFKCVKNKTFIIFQYIDVEQRFKFWTGRDSNSDVADRLIAHCEAGYLDFMLNKNGDDIIFSATIFTNVDDSCKLSEDELDFFLDNKMVRAGLRTYIKNNINTTVIN